MLNDYREHIMYEMFLYYVFVQIYLLYLYKTFNHFLHTENKFVRVQK